jgi:hypothetical protein
MIKSNFLNKFAGIVFITFVFLLFVSSCEHEDAMDTGVGPIQPGSVDSVARFSWIQANIFDQKCAVPGCHVQGSAAFDLVLSEGQSYGNLVDIPAQGPQSFTIMRVKPGLPDSSYLVWKIEGRQGIEGQRMPRGAPPLTPGEIDAVIRWIRGATFNKVD